MERNVSFYLTIAQSHHSITPYNNLDLQSKDMVTMLFYTGLFFLVIAVSLDGFGVGITYGIRKIDVPFVALLIIMACSGFIVLLSMTVGNIISSFISPYFSQMLGGAILIFLGLFSLLNIYRANSSLDVPSQPIDKNNRFEHFKTVVTTPNQADLDQSGTISAGEALLLGAALALDAFGAGIGAAIIGYSPLVTAILIAFMSGLFVLWGIKIGLLLSNLPKLERLTLLPPLILITLGIFNMM